ncbi:Predicted oxidoreductase [Streptomyces misionensis]|uniref:Predicted oxidoreductase n=1 Tax=Streptomyces misionensis TaxID=67331 RepID=A0A1H4MCH1_9ACTN|nr:aldo/keto reductase [Streptomyces misionensis]SEB80444.1 Predicted oxidoreductase [Streptomyces misionensis]
MAARTDIRAHRLVYGCMGLGGGWDSRPYTSEDIRHAETAIEAALAAGITAFDHADIYRYGKSEAVFGEVLARTPGLRRRIVIQGKCGIRLPDGERPGHYDLRGASIRRRVEESLVRLRTDALDVLLLHRPDPLADPEDIAEALTSLHAQGLVRQFGVSNMSGPQIALLQAHLDVPLVVDQLEMSLARRDWVEAGVLFNTPAGAGHGFAAGTLEHCAAQGIRLQAWGPLARGSLIADPDSAVCRLVTNLARRKGTTPQTVLLWWPQRHPGGHRPGHRHGPTRTHRGLPGRGPARAGPHPRGVVRAVGRRARRAPPLRRGMEPGTGAPPRQIRPASRAGAGPFTPPRSRRSRPLRRPAVLPDAVVSRSRSTAAPDEVSSAGRHGGIRSMKTGYGRESDLRVEAARTGRGRRKSRLCAGAPRHDEQGELRGPSPPSSL